MTPCQHIRRSNDSPAQEAGVNTKKMRALIFRDILLISGECSPREQQVIRRQGFELLLKPLDIEDLNRRLAAIESAS